MAKRSADVQLAKDGVGFTGDGSGDNSDGSKATRASSAQLAKRKILSTRRPGGASARSTSRPGLPSQPQSNMFGGPTNDNGSIMNGNAFAQSNDAFGTNANPNPFASSQTQGTGPSLAFGGSQPTPQSGVAPPSSGFNFNSGNSGFQFNSNNTNGTAATGFQGSLFNIPSTASTVASSPRRSASPTKEHTAKKNNTMPVDQEAKWAPNAPFLTSTPAPSNQPSSPFASNGFNSQIGASQASGLNLFAPVPTPTPQSNLFNFNSKPQDQSSVFSFAPNPSSAQQSQPQFSFNTPKLAEPIPPDDNMGEEEEPPEMANKEAASQNNAAQASFASTTPFNFANSQVSSTPTQPNFFTSKPVSQAPATSMFSTPQPTTTASFFTTQAPATAAPKFNLFQPNGSFAPPLSESTTPTKPAPVPLFANLANTTASVPNNIFTDKSATVTEPVGKSSTTTSIFAPKSSTSEQAENNSSTFNFLNSSAPALGLAGQIAESSNMFSPKKPLFAPTPSESSKTSTNLFPSQPSTATATSASATTNNNVPLSNSVVPGFGPSTGSSQPPATFQPTQGHSFTPAKAPSVATISTPAQAKAAEIAINGIDVDALKVLKVECLTLVPQIPGNLTGSQRDEYILAYRLMCLDKGLKFFVTKMLGSDAEIRMASQYYDVARSVVFQAAGIKRTADAAELEETQTSNKRPNINGPVTSGAGSRAPLFGMPTASKRKSDEEVDASPKKARGDDVSYPDVSQNSQTSQLFANLAKPAAQSQTSSPLKSNPLFSASPSKPLDFGSAPKVASAGATSTKPLFEATPAEKPAASSSTPFGGSSGSASTGSAFKLSTPNTSASSANASSQAKPQSSLMGIFGDSSKKYEEELKQKKKDSDWDSEEETEEEWERKYDENLAKERAATRTSSNIPKFTVAPSTNFMAQFGKSAGQAAKDMEKQAKEKRKADDWDEDEMSESEWDRRDDEEQARIKKEHEAKSKSEALKFKPGNASPALSGTSAGSIFSTNGPISRTPTPNIFENLSRNESDIEGSKTGDADNEESDESDQEEDSGDGAKTPTVTPGRSLFDRIDKDENGNPIKDPSVADSSNLFAASTGSTGSAGDHTWKQDTPIKFAASGTAPSLSITAPSPSKTPAAGGSAFGNLFGTPKADAPKPVSTNPFAHLSSSTPAQSSSTGFDFASQLKSAASGGLTPSSVFASAASSRGTSPGVTTAEESTGEEPPADDPQLDLSEVRAGEEHEEVLFTVRAKALELASEESSEPKSWLTRGLGNLRVLKNRDTKKTRMVLRSGPASKVALNTGLQSTIKYAVEGKKSVKFLVASANGISQWSLQVKEAADAEKLAAVLEANKKA